MAKREWTRNSIQVIYNAVASWLTGVGVGEGHK